MSSPGPSSLSLKRVIKEEPYNRALCIFCQTDDQCCHVTTGVKGCASIKRAAEERNDYVHKRLKTYHNTSDSEVFYYHNTYPCFKKYILGSDADYKSPKYESVPEDETEEPVGKLRKSDRNATTPVEPPSSGKNPDDMICTKCGHVKHKGVKMKAKLSETNRTLLFIKAVKHNQDMVFTRVAHRIRDDDQQSVASFLAADFFFHKNCIKSYLNAFEKKQVKNESSTTDFDMKQSLFNRAVPYFDKMLAVGECCTISEAVLFIMGLLEPNESINGTLYNRDVKSFLLSHYGDNIVIEKNERVYESEIVFSSSVRAGDIAIKLKNQNVYSECGKGMREDIKQQVDFNLEDSFCDSNDLKESWERTRMPDSMLTFFSALFDIPKHKLFKMSTKNLNEFINAVLNDWITGDAGRMDEENADEKEETWIRDHKSIQLFCLFQIMYYILFHGRRRTPLHILIGHSMYARDRSKTLMTAFNRVGVCSSYPFIRFLRQMLAAYAIWSSGGDGDVPIPSNLNKEDFTMAGTDNSNYRDHSSLSGTKGCDYAAMVLFQQMSQPAGRKPPVSATGINRSNAYDKSVLPCQNVPPYEKPALRPSLPKDMVLVPDNAQVEHLDIQGARDTAAKHEFAISLARVGLDFQDPPTWQGVKTLISSAIISLQRVGFLPVVPKPITERATVRHVGTCLQNVRKQLGQRILPVWADEAVYEHLAEMCLNEPDKFREILPLLGPFHLTKVLLKIQGKFLRGSGVDDAFIECAVFGPGVVEAVLNGSHYVRSLAGVLMVEDLVMKLVWQEFWRHNNKQNYHPALQHVAAFQKKLAVKERCEEEFSVMVNSLEGLQKDFLAFKVSTK